MDGALVLGAVAPVFALIGAGYVFARRLRLGDEAVAPLNAFTLRLALPALLFASLATTTPREIWQPGFLIAFSAGMIAAALGGMWMPRRAPAALPARVIDGLAAGYANTAFMGIPLLAALGGRLGGPGAVLPAVLASILTVCLLFAVGCALIEIDLHRHRPPRVAIAHVLAALARNPLIAAPVAGALWSALGLGWPAPLARFTDLLGGAATPVALVTIGMFLAQPFLAQPRGARAAGAAGGLWPVVALKLVAQPAVTAAVALWVVTMPVAWSSGAILMAALPTGTGPFMVARLYGREAALAARATLVTTLLSVVTVSVLAAVLPR